MRFPPRPPGPAARTKLPSFERMKLPVGTPWRVQGCELVFCISGVERGNASLRLKHPQSPARKDMIMIGFKEGFRIKEIYNCQRKPKALVACPQIDRSQSLQISTINDKVDGSPREFISPRTKAVDNEPPRVRVKETCRGKKGRKRSGKRRADRLRLLQASTFPMHWPDVGITHIPFLIDKLIGPLSHD